METRHLERNLLVNKCQFMNSVLSKVNTNNLIDQHHQLTSITKGTWVALQTENRKKGFGGSVLHKVKYIENKQIPMLPKSKTKQGT